jgi:hypothetical protein
MSARLPAGLEVSGLMRRVGAEGGFAVVVAKGDPEAGTILLILCENGANTRAYERMPSLDGPRLWQCSRREDDGRNPPFAQWLERRKNQDQDLWIVELDIAQGERFIGL